MEVTIMKKILKILKWTGIGIFILVIVLVIFVYANANRTYDAPYPEITASNDLSIIARGEYLIYGPAHCAHCHAPHLKLNGLMQAKKFP
jgi:mono/diheme cytochrome c family protein